MRSSRRPDGRPRQPVCSVPAATRSSISLSVAPSQSASTSRLWSPRRGAGPRTPDELTEKRYGIRMTPRVPPAWSATCATTRPWRSVGESSRSTFGARRPTRCRPRRARRAARVGERVIQTPSSRPERRTCPPVTPRPRRRRHAGRRREPPPQGADVGRDQDRSTRRLPPVPTGVRRIGEAVDGLARLVVRGHDRFEHADVDVLTDARGRPPTSAARMAIVVCSAVIWSANDIAYVDDRAAVDGRLTGEQPGLGVDHGHVGGPARLRSCLAEPRDRRHHQARVAHRQLGEPEAGRASTPGRKFSITMSAWAARRRISSTAAGT